MAVSLLGGMKLRLLTIRMEAWDLSTRVLKLWASYLIPHRFLCQIENGPPAVGCGKSTLLHALIGDVVSKASGVTIRGSVAYASQSPFILNATLQDNILFGKKYD